MTAPPIPQAPATNAQDWAHHFTSFSVYHLVCVSVCAAIMFGVAFLGRRFRGTPRGDHFRIAVGSVGLIYWIASNIWWNWPGNFELGDSLPIQICDLAGLIGPLSLFWRNRTLRSILYFWGIALSIQGFIQPVLVDGYAFTRFWLFWSNHTVIVGTAIYDVVALGFRPSIKDYVRASAALFLYLLLILPFDILLHVNYGYVGNIEPKNKTLIQSLGPWPWRIVPLAALAYLAMFLIYSPWWIVERRSRRGRCPKCGYDMSGLPDEACCPECGFQEPAGGHQLHETSNDRDGR